MNYDSTAAPGALPLVYSSARRWDALCRFVLDALADAVHHRAAMGGAAVHSLSLLVSRRHLNNSNGPEMQRQLEALSAELRRLRLPHSINQVVPGDAEPEQHQLRITLQEPER